MIYALSIYEQLYVMNETFEIKKEFGCAKFVSNPQIDARIIKTNKNLNSNIGNNQIYERYALFTKERENEICHFNLLSRYLNLIITRKNKTTISRDLWPYLKRAHKNNIISS